MLRFDGPKLGLTLDCVLVRYYNTEDERKTATAVAEEEDLPAGSRLAHLVCLSLNLMLTFREFRFASFVTVVSLSITKWTLVHLLTVGLVVCLK